MMTNVDVDKRAAAIDGLYKVTGNFAAGFTRPLDVLNKAVGFATGTDTAKDAAVPPPPPPSCHSPHPSSTPGWSPPWRAGWCWAPRPRSGKYL